MYMVFELIADHADSMLIFVSRTLVSAKLYDIVPKCHFLLQDAKRIKTQIESKRSITNKLQKISSKK
ncbi:unnamed protein product [Meloidogyne enterolobii]|uniref:Uncharacterized protein n=1 Tax=Meloidogyne enterolobii TaxID=390850 RepID=A0ACB1AB36_MELEN